MGPKPTTQNLLTGETEILKAALNYNIGLLTKNTVQPQDLNEAGKSNIYTSQQWQAKRKELQNHLKGKHIGMYSHSSKEINKKMFRQITKAGMDFQDAMFDYMADFIFNEMVPETND